MRKKKVKPQLYAFGIFKKSNSLPVCVIRERVNRYKEYIRFM